MGNLEKRDFLLSWTNMADYESSEKLESDCLQRAVCEWENLVLGPHLCYHGRRKQRPEDNAVAR